jgi:RNA processing factor Prp31
LGSTREQVEEKVEQLHSISELTKTRYCPVREPDQRAEGREQRAEGREQRAEGREQRAEGRDQRA